MRITSGRFGGRLVKVPKTADVRPTQDRVRAALFNMIQAEVAGGDFLDLFAGSGAVGLEALSWGASSATFVESDLRHLAVLKANAEALLGAGHPGATLVRRDAFAYLATYIGKDFSVVFADPPYALGVEKGYAEMLCTLHERAVVRPGGLFVAEMVSSQQVEALPEWTILRDREYGKTRLVVWQHG